jgi:low affinity Fe/Cu permease
MKSLERFSEKTTQLAGSSWALGIAFLLTLIWVSAGPFFGFTDIWQLTYNTFSSVVTFLMVFIIQRDQKKTDARFADQA